MKSVLIVLFTILLLAQHICTQSLHARVENANDANSSRALDFVKGFCFGVASKISNVTECVKQTELSIHEFTDSYTQIRQGVKTLSPSIVLEGIVNFGKGLNSLALDLKKCGAARLVDDIKRLANEVKTGGVLKVIVKEAVNIWHHKTEVTKFFLNFIKYYGTAQYTFAGVELGQLVFLLLEPSK
ncbi:hypothetical protein AKO1_003206 [Acrasis kona]|uniref:Uncharacterized protein n=1 Tax=Acrasis kona TaxID=1008807 RepID=A0AAW2ZN69_9EUKA